MVHAAHRLEVHASGDMPSLHQPIAVGSLYDCERWLADLREDRRFTCSVLVAADGERVVGALPCTLSRDGRLPGALNDLERGPDVADGGSGLMLLGGLSRLRGGVLASARLDSTLVDAAVAALFQEAVARARRADATVIAPYVPAEQVPAMCSVATTRVEPADVWSELEVRSLTGAGLDSAPRKARQTLRADRVQLARAGLHVTRENVDTALVKEAAPLVAAVGERNGVRTHPLIAELELVRWLRYDPSSAVAFCVRAGDGELIAVSFGRARDGALEVHECGLASDHPARGVLYSAVFAVAPLDYAGENGLHTVELGCGHPIPKKVRGASQTRLWHVREAGPVGGHR